MTRRRRYYDPGRQPQPRNPSAHLRQLTPGMSPAEMLAFHDETERLAELRAGQPLTRQQRRAADRAARDRQPRDIGELLP